MRVNVDVFFVGRYLIRRKNPKTMIGHVTVGVSFVRGPCLERGREDTPKKDAPRSGSNIEQMSTLFWKNLEQMRKLIRIQTCDTAWLKTTYIGTKSALPPLHFNFYC